jgi:hypothetical protein
MEYWMDTVNYGAGPKTQLSGSAQPLILSGLTIR